MTTPEVPQNKADRELSEEDLEQVVGGTERNYEELWAQDVSAMTDVYGRVEKITLTH